MTHKTKHTTGYWVADTKAAILMDNKDRHIADFGFPDVPERDANLRLCAAAPKLLKAGRKLHLRWNDYIHLAKNAGESDEYIN